MKYRIIATSVSNIFGQNMLADSIVGVEYFYPDQIKELVDNKIIEEVREQAAVKEVVIKQQP